MSHPTATELVERQMRNWELARSQRPEAPAPEKHEVEDFVCLSRMPGVDGKRIAERISHELSWPVFDREILDLMAGDDFHRKQVYAAMDERDLAWSEQLIRSFLDARFARNDYFHRLCETLLLLARKGNAVFLGRGADLILPAERGFRVRLAASLEHRVAALAGRRRIPPAEARQEIERIEQERGRFFGQHFRLEANDPMRYDITLNVERFTEDQIVETILAARRIVQRS